ncbi:MAG: protein translocase subunit SecD [Patescibacteria group bacterium]|nr:protein translocase subunit SecD [Patescibacteria group bacterium]MDE2588484.1 protein translocase subunit SecD [Patescibacteria group bacterium]
MKQHPRLFFSLIVLLTALAVILVMPQTKPFSFKTPKLPGLNKSYAVTLPFGGSTIALNAGKLQFEKIYPFQEGLDLAGGTSVTLRAEMKNIPQSQRSSALDSARLVLERRVNLYGVKEPTIQTAQVGSDYRLIVDLPGVNVNQAVSLIGSTAQLSFWELGASGSGKLRDLNTLPIGMLQVLGPDASQTELTGKDLKSSTVTFDPNTGKPQVQLQFTDQGAKKFGDITGRNIGKPLVIVLDNQVIEAPTVQQQILGGNAVITGTFTQDQANQIAIELQAGALPVPLTILEQHSIGATLGASSLQRSLFAGILGIIVIIVFMISLYGGLGFVASTALILYTFFVLAIFKLIPVTLTLAGIAGFILSIGMAVDANILIFERTKEELRSGKKYAQAIELGFSRAWSSIRDSNISTLITSFILFKFGTGIVRGFALTLAIGVLVSMFSAIVVTRTFLRVFHKQ